ncbi:hypothetical protein H310_13335 [Aphanomyces invadans]|uniref:Uncharacterized protein n=1 Tax=Aphanomyces invadans TaxID=157072 RepID=A0A024TDN7_9STRA|nr:hypothetical protein H310_13335 [Aphanomyces invadans]ETV92270.1 hypothetical protein H310_13335 [Aphanomyces invadans]|eukprot:XP_008879021.1 hypothetical protein H310_13335 [Aphanomyces invadans]
MSTESSTEASKATRYSRRLAGLAPETESLGRTSRTKTVAPADHDNSAGPTIPPPERKREADGSPNVSPPTDRSDTRSAPKKLAVMTEDVMAPEDSGQDVEDAGNEYQLCLANPSPAPGSISLVQEITGSPGSWTPIPNDPDIPVVATLVVINGEGLELGRAYGDLMRTFEENQKIEAQRFLKQFYDERARLLDAKETRLVGMAEELARAVEAHEARRQDDYRKALAYLHECYDRELELACSHAKTERVLRAARMESDHSREDALSRLHEDLRNTKRSHQEELTALLAEARREIDGKESAYEMREARRTQEISTLREELHLVTMELDAAKSAQRRQEALNRANSTCGNCPVLQDAKDKLQADVQDLERRLQAALNRPNLPCGNCPALQKANDDLQDRLRGLELRVQEADLNQKRVALQLEEAQGFLQDAERRVRETHELLLLEREKHEKDLDEHHESMRQLEHDVQEQFMSLGQAGNAPTEQERSQLNADRAALEHETAINQDVLARIEDGLARQETNRGLLNQSEEQLRRDRYSHEARAKRLSYNVEKREWELRKQADRFRLSSLQAPYGNPTLTPSRKGSPSGKTSATFVTNPLMPASFSVASTPRYHEVPLIVQTLQHTEVMTETEDLRAPPTYPGRSFEPQPFAPSRTGSASNPDVTGRVAGNVGGLSTNSAPYRTAGSSGHYPGGHYGGGYQPGQDDPRGTTHTVAEVRVPQDDKVPLRDTLDRAEMVMVAVVLVTMALEDAAAGSLAMTVALHRATLAVVVMAVVVPAMVVPLATRRQALADARKYAPKLDSVNRPIALEHFLAKFDAILDDYGNTERQFVSIFDDRLSQSGEGVHPQDRKPEDVRDH